jgi:hypothetical protein
MIKQDLQCWFNRLPLDDRLQVQKFVLVLYCIGDKNG